MSEAVALHVPEIATRTDISDPMTAIAVTAVFSRAQARAHEVIITDNPSAMGLRTLMIIGESDLASARAIELIRARKLGSACPRDLIHAVPALVRTLSSGCVAIPDEVVVRARRAPALSDELFEVLSLVRLGYSNAQVANRMHCSLATAKRRIHELTVVFEVQNRLELVTKTRSV